MLGAIASHYAATVSFKPTDLSGLMAWYSAEAETGYADNDTIATWNDLSAANNDTASATGPVKWRSGAGSAGGPALEFGYHKFFTLPTNIMSGVSAGEAFALIKSNGGGGGEAGFWRFGTAGTSSHYPFSNGLSYIDFGSSARQDGIDTSAKAVTSWRRLNLWSASNDWAMLLDETSIRTNSSNTVAWSTAPTLGNNDAGAPAAPSLLTMACFLLFNRKLTSGERSSVIAWMVANPGGGLP